MVNVEIVIFWDGVILVELFLIVSGVVLNIIVSVIVMDRWNVLWSRYRVCVF